MKLTRILVPAIAGALTAAVAAPVAAAPDGPQRLRGMEGRSFAVEVSLPDGTLLFPNCYTFTADGTWIDPPLAAAGLLGTWEQDRVGASTPYAATIDTPLGPVVQNGTVGPAAGTGTLQLTATTDVPEGLLGPGAPAVTVVSVGEEVPSCD